MMDYRSKYSELFLKIESEVGTTKLNSFILSALRNAVHKFQEKNEQDFFDQFHQLLESVKNTEPRIALVIDSLYDVWRIISEEKKREHPTGHQFWERKVIESLEKGKKMTREESKQMDKHGVAEVKKNDVILIHSISHTVLDVLVSAKKEGKNIKVIIAEQESEKTQQLIEVLTRHDIRFQVVPEYMLSHIESEITKVFLGGVTINNGMNVVADAGSNAIVSEFHLRKSPIYLFISTRKFSLWKSRESHHTYKVKSIRTYSEGKPITFERIKFSHDRVPLEYYDYVITEMGKMTPKEIQKLYLKKFEERASWREEFFKD